MRVIKAPDPIDDFISPDCVAARPLTMFLGGSIEMDTAERWHDRLVSDISDLDIVAFNPRRDDWDSSWQQTSNDLNFRTQVTWELKALSAADIVVFYLDPNTKSPITLLEIGLTAAHRTGTSTGMIICCPDGFWRKGNIEMVSECYSVPLVDTYSGLIRSIRKSYNYLKPFKSNTTNYR